MKTFQLCVYSDTNQRPVFFWFMHWCLCTLSCCFIPPDMFVFCFVYSVLLFPPNRETSWKIHLQGSVANGLTNTIQLIPNHFNLTLSIFNKSYWWSLAEDLSLSSVQWMLEMSERSTIHSLCSFKINDQLDLKWSDYHHSGSKVKLILISIGKRRSHNW